MVSGESTGLRCTMNQLLTSQNRRRSWASLMQGTFTVSFPSRPGVSRPFLELTAAKVINAIQPWKHESSFQPFIDEHIALASPRISSVAAPAALLPEGVLLLERAYEAVRKIHPYTMAVEGGPPRAEDLMAFLQGLRGLQNPTSEQLFEVLQPLRTWLFWLPTAMLQNPQSDSIAMAVLAQFYATALAVDPLFPVLGGAYLGSLSTLPVEEIDRILCNRQAANPYDEDVQVAVASMDFAREMVHGFRERQGYAGRPLEATTAQSSPYQFHALSLGSKSTTPGSSNDPPSSGYQRSLEDLHFAGTRAQPPYAEASPRPSIRGLEDRTLAAFGGPALSPSPAYSPGYLDDEQYNVFENPSWSYNGGFVAPTLWT